MFKFSKTKQTFISCLLIVSVLFAGCHPYRKTDFVEFNFDYSAIYDKIEDDHRSPVEREKDFSDTLTKILGSEELKQYIPDESRNFFEDLKNNPSTEKAKETLSSGKKQLNDAKESLFVTLEKVKPHIGAKDGEELKKIVSEYCDLTDKIADTVMDGIDKLRSNDPILSGQTKKLLEQTLGKGVVEKHKELKTQMDAKMTTAVSKLNKLGKTELAQKLKTDGNLVTKCVTTVVLIVLAVVAAVIVTVPLALAGVLSLIGYALYYIWGGKPGDNPPGGTGPSTGTSEQLDSRSSQYTTPSDVIPSPPDGTQIITIPPVNEDDWNYIAFTSETKKGYVVWQTDDVNKKNELNITNDGNLDPRLQKLFADFASLHVVSVAGTPDDYPMTLTLAFQDGTKSFADVGMTDEDGKPLKEMIIQWENADSPVVVGKSKVGKNIELPTGTGEGEHGMTMFQTDAGVEIRVIKNENGQAVEKYKLPVLNDNEIRVYANSPGAFEVHVDDDKIITVTLNSNEPSPSEVKVIYEWTISDDGEIKQTGKR